MPHFQTVTNEIVGFAHCTNHRGTCPGYDQEQVPAFRDEVSHAFIGAPGNAIENTSIYFRFVNEDDAECPHCHGYQGEGLPRLRREVSDVKRRVYQEFIPGQIAPPVPPSEAADDLAALRAELQAEIELLRAERTAA